MKKRKAFTLKFVKAPGRWWLKRPFDAGLMLCPSGLQRFCFHWFGARLKVSRVESTEVLITFTPSQRGEFYLGMGHRVRVANVGSQLSYRLTIDLHHFLHRRLGDQRFDISIEAEWSERKRHEA